MRSVVDMDRHLFLLVHSRWRAGWIDPIMIWFTRAGTKGTLWLGLAAGLLLDSHGYARRAAQLSVAALLLAEGLINLVLKPVIARERSFHRNHGAVPLVTLPGPHSWPSAHAGSSVAAACVLGFTYPLWAPVLLGAALVIAYSRMYVGVHYPLDVLAGIFLGLGCSGVVVAVTLTLLPGLRV